MFHISHTNISCGFGREGGQGGGERRIEVIVKMAGQGLVGGEGGGVRVDVNEELK